MERAQRVKQKAQKLIKEGRKPSAELLVRELGYSEADVHRCLNFLEREDEIETYTKQVFSSKQRMIGVKR